MRLLTAGSLVRVQLEEPRRNGLYFVPIFLMRKISHTCRRSSFFAKRHARLACSLVNALTTAYCRYHLFAIQAPSAHKYPKGSYRPPRVNLFMQVQMNQRACEPLADAGNRAATAAGGGLRERGELCRNTMK